jgi:hypothetical protein
MTLTITVVCLVAFAYALGVVFALDYERGKHEK